MITEDEKDIKNWIRESDYHDLVRDDWLFIWLASRRTLREKQEVTDFGEVHREGKDG